MGNTYKPDAYNSVSPYFVVKGTPQLIELLKQVFDAEELRRYDRADGSIMHVELKIDDTVIMLGESSDDYPPNQVLVHVYVPNVDATFKKALDAGCELIDLPQQKDGDPDRRGMFKDFNGNVWAVSTQLEG